jgi:hypothetical protein
MELLVCSYFVLVGGSVVWNLHPVVAGFLEKRAHGVLSATSMNKKKCFAGICATRKVQIAACHPIWDNKKGRLTWVD